MEAYRLTIPTRIYFGRDILQGALQAQSENIKENIMIVTTGRSLIRNGYVEELESDIRKISKVKKVIVFDTVSANPKLSEVREGVCLGIEESIQQIVGFGGGSAIDAAKAIAAGIGTRENLDKFFYEGKEPSKNVLPIIAIPTTAGTGSELSKAAILTDRERKMKKGIRGEALYPTVAIVDSRLTETVPFKTTMETGFDVLAHAVESYLSKVANPFTSMQSEYAIKIVGEYLPKLAENLRDIEAREKVSFASMLMGINLGNASTCLPHRLQYPIGAHTDTSHGAGLAALFSAWLENCYEYVPERFNIVAELLSGKVCVCKKEVREVFRKLLHTLKLPKSLEDLGITEAMIPTLVSEVTGNLANDPAGEVENIVEKIYLSALKG